MNAQDAVLAGRYAKAYLAAAQDAKAVTAAREELRRFVEKRRDNEDLAERLKHPLLPPDEKMKAAAKALGKMSPLFENFFTLLLEKKRLHLIDAIDGQFEKLADEAEGRARLKVTSALPLGKAETARLTEKLSKSLKKPVVLEVAQDPSLIGGLVLQSGDRVWDLSFKGRLENLAEHLSAEHKN